MKEYLAQTNQQSSTNYYSQLAVDVTTGLIVSFAPVFISAIAAWLFLNTKNQIKILLEQLNSIFKEVANVPELTPQEEEQIRFLLKDLTKHGFNRCSLFFLEQVRKKNHLIYANSFSVWLEYSSDSRTHVKENKHLYSAVNIEINSMLENKQNYVNYQDYNKGKINKEWLKKRYTKAYFLYLINEKYTGFLLLEKTRCSISCPGNSDKIIQTCLEIAQLINN